MEFDLYFLRKKTAIGKFMVQKLNRIFAMRIKSLFEGQNSCKFLEIGPGVGAFAEVLHAVMVHAGKIDILRN